VCVTYSHFFFLRRPRRATHIHNFWTPCRPLRFPRVYVHIHMHVYAHPRVYVHMYTCMFMYICVYTCVHMYPGCMCVQYEDLYMLICTYAHVYVCMYISTDMCHAAHVYMRMCVDDTHIHTLADAGRVWGSAAPCVYVRARAHTHTLTLNTSEGSGTESFRRGLRRAHYQPGFGTPFVFYNHYNYLYLFMCFCALLYNNQRDFAP